MEPILPIERARVFFDATLGPIRLKHPEGVAVAPDGAVWCGGDGGEIYRIAPDGSAIEQIASTGGFTLGLAFDTNGALFTLRSGPSGGLPTRSGHPCTGKIRNRRWAGDDADAEFPGGRCRPRRALRFRQPARRSGRSGYLALRPRHRPGWTVVRPAIEFRQWDGPLTGSGLALRGGDFRSSGFPGRDRAGRIAGAYEQVIEGIDRLPDGIAFGADGQLYIACYEPSRLYVADSTGGWSS